MALDRDDHEQMYDDNCGDHINYHNTNYSNVYYVSQALTLFGPGGPKKKWFVLNTQEFRMPKVKIQYFLIYMLGMIKCAT